MKKGIITGGPSSSFKVATIPVAYKDLSFDFHMRFRNVRNDAQNFLSMRFVLQIELNISFQIICAKYKWLI